MPEMVRPGRAASLHQLVAGSTAVAAVRAGWNDAAWGQVRRVPNAMLEKWYEQGYTGGMIFRKKQQQSASAQDALFAVIGKASPG